MTTLPLHAPYQPNIWTHISHFFSRVAAVTRTVLDTYAEAQDQAHEMEKRYPFTYWS